MKAEVVWSAPKPRRLLHLTEFIKGERREGPNAWRWHRLYSRARSQTPNCYCAASTRKIVPNSGRLRVRKTLGLLRDLNCFC